MDLQELSNILDLGPIPIVAELPTSYQPMGVYNLKESPGTHWVSWVCSENKAFVFDSLGSHYIDPPLLEYLRKFSKTQSTNPITVQPPNSSDLCGEWALCFLWHWKNGKVGELFAALGDDLERNDEWLVRFYAKF